MDGGRKPEAGKPEVGGRRPEGGGRSAGLPDSGSVGGRRPVTGQADDATHRGRTAGWGIDACLSVHVDPVSLPEWVALLRQSNVRWLRERGVWIGDRLDTGIRGRMEALHAAGFNIVAFAGTSSSVTAQREGNQLPEDLLAVYASGFRQGREYAGLVSAWEMTGEPDVGYCRDLPDRLAAYNKAMYLGLKSGAASAFQARVRLGKNSDQRWRSASGGRKGTGPALPSAARPAGSPPPRSPWPSTLSPLTLARLLSQTHPRLSEKIKFKETDAAGAGGALGAPTTSSGQAIRPDGVVGSPGGLEHKRGDSNLNLQLPSSTHDGRTPIVLMGALALPPGPWWERAADNGLLDYTDAYNFHFYGNAEDLTSVIRAHREAVCVAPTAGRGWIGDMKPDQRSSLHREQDETRSGKPDGVVGSPTGWRNRKRGLELKANSSSLTARRQPPLPLWLTECGVSAMVPGDFLNAERREFQAEFTRTTARQALAARDVAMFMPFILVNRDDPHAMTLSSPPAPLPAWDAYAKLTRETEWPRRVLSAPAGERANPVVVQWMPAEGTVSHKVAGTYRVGPNEVLSGEFRVYNFGERAVEGELSADADSLSHKFKLKKDGGAAVGSRTAESPDSRTLRSNVVGSARSGLRFFTAAGVADRVTLSIPAGGYVAVPVIYTPGADTGYFREWIKVGFREASGRVSPVAFGVERSPEEADFTREPVAVYPLRGDSRLKPPEVNVETPREKAAPHAVFPESVWRVFNGLEARSYERTANSSELAGGVRFSVAKPVNDPLAPTYALAALRGVPEDARFLRVRLDRPMTRNATVRVDLVDANGERFTIWENLGNPYGGSSRDVWLGLADFHPYFWSKAVAGNRRLRPDKVREISLRFYLIEGGSRVVELEWMRARSAR